MTYKKNVLNMVIAGVCLAVFILTAIYCVPRLALLSSKALTATVVSADRHGTSGYATLKLDGSREDGGTIFFHYYYPGSRSHLKQDENVLVSGGITFMDESTAQGVNSELVIGTRTPVLVCAILCFLSLVGAILLLPMTINNFRRKPWGENGGEKTKIVSALYTAEILAILVAIILFVAGAAQTGRYVCKKNHTTGTITYQSTRQSSQRIKVYSGKGSRTFKSVYGKGVRSTYTVLQIRADHPIDGEEEFWYEGNNIVLGGKKAYIGYDGSDVCVLSQAELIMTIVGGGFLLLHVLSALLIGKKNPYGGRVFWFYKI